MKGFAINGIILGNSDTLLKCTRAGSTYYPLFSATDRTNGDVQVMIYLDEHGAVHTRLKTEFMRKYKPLTGPDPLIGVFKDRLWYIWRDDYDRVTIYNTVRGLFGYGNGDGTAMELPITPHTWATARALVKKGTGVILDRTVMPSERDCNEWLKTLDEVAYMRTLA